MQYEDLLARLCAFIVPIIAGYCVGKFLHNRVWSTVLGTGLGVLMGFFVLWARFSS